MLLPGQFSFGVYSLGEILRSEIVWIVITLMHIIDETAAMRVGFLPVQTSFTVHRGESVMLPCTVINIGMNTVTWRKVPYITPITTGSQLFVQDQRFQPIHKPWKNEWNLSIKNVQPHDAGVYECQVSGRRNPIRQNFTLTVIDAIRHRNADIKITGEKFFNQGETIFLLCTANGREDIPDDIQWFKNGERMHTDLMKVVIKKHIAHNAGVITSSLEVRQSDIDDIGIYVCRATSHREPNLITSVKVHVLNIPAKPFPSKRGTNKDGTIGNESNYNHDDTNAASVTTFSSIVILTHTVLAMI